MHIPYVLLINQYCRPSSIPAASSCPGGHVKQRYMMVVDSKCVWAQCRGRSPTTIKHAHTHFTFRTHIENVHTWIMRIIMWIHSPPKYTLGKNSLCLTLVWAAEEPFSSAYPKPESPTTYTQRDIGKGAMCLMRHTWYAYTHCVCMCVCIDVCLCVLKRLSSRVVLPIFEYARTQLRRRKGEGVTKHARVVHKFNKLSTRALSANVWRTKR